MKRFFAAILVLMLCGCCIAEDEQVVTLADCELLPGEILYIDMDGDMLEEKVEFVVVTDGEEEYKEIYIEMADGDESYFSFGEYILNVYIVDIDADGIPEMLASWKNGDETEPAITTAIHYIAEKDGLERIRFIHPGAEGGLMYAIKSVPVSFADGRLVMQPETGEQEIYELQGDVLMLVTENLQEDGE